MSPSRRSWLVAAIVPWLGLSAGAAAQETSPPKAPPAAQPAPAAADAFKLTGFRSATFGMTEAELRQAIKRDFPAAAERIKREPAPTERTTALVITVNDLLPVGGPAQLNYLLGFKSKKLTQVSVLWGGAANPRLAKADALAAANLLRDHLLTVGYRPEGLVVNHRAVDGSIVVFRGTDAQNRMTVLLLSGVETPEGAPAQPPALHLAYVLDPQNPDIYRIGRGQF